MLTNELEINVRISQSSDLLGRSKSDFRRDQYVIALLSVRQIRSHLFESVSLLLFQWIDMSCATVNRFYLPVLFTVIALCGSRGVCLDRRAFETSRGQNLRWQHLYLQQALHIGTSTLVNLWNERQQIQGGLPHWDSALLQTQFLQEIHGHHCEA